MTQEKIDYMAVGRRKEAVARVKITSGAGKVLVNSEPLDKYFTRETDRIIIKRPLEMTKTLGKYDVYARIKGGGFSGQAGALQHGIARALVEKEPDLREILRKLGFLTRDPRMKERKKYGQKGARKRFQWTKR